MLKDINQENILFLDIETVPQWAEYHECPDLLRDLWDKKIQYFTEKTGETPEELWPRAGIYAEFGKVICVSTACFRKGKLRVRSFCGHSESDLLVEFAEMLNRAFKLPQHLLCAHNGKEFDFPYLARRMVVKGIPLPDALDIAGKKPWMVRHLDTMELWKFGDYKNYTSLELLAAVLGIPTPKDDICGGDVCRIYWQEDDLQRIVDYCMKDVVTVARIFLKYRTGSELPDDRIEFV
jgi:uncharacterized protein YprB with RNaseH-like and TPR domain